MYYDTIIFRFGIFNKGHCKVKFASFLCWKCNNETPHITFSFVKFKVAPYLFKCNSAITSFFNCNFIASARSILPIHFIIIPLSPYPISFPFISQVSLMHPHAMHISLFFLSLSALLCVDADARLRSRVARKMK